MINLADLPENLAELLHEELTKDIPDPASKPQKDAEPSDGISEDALAALYGELLSGQRRMQDEINGLRTELAAEAKKAASLQVELDRIQALYAKTLLTDETPSASKENYGLHTVGVAALLAPLIFGLGWLLSWVLQRWAGRWNTAGGTLLACIACIVLGLFLLLLAKRSNTLLRWLLADDWPEGAEEEFVGKEE